MKVLLIDVNCKHSSTGKIVYDLYTELNASGNEAAICYGRGPLIKEPNIFKFGIDLETLFHAGMTRLTGLTGFFSIFSTLRLINYMEHFKPDVVHIHELHAYFVNIGRLMNYLKKRNIKTIWTFHCEFMYTGKCGHAHDCEKFKTECHACPQLREYPKSLVFDFTRFMYSRKKQYFEGFNNLIIVTPSVWLARRVGQSFLKNSNIEVIYNGIDSENIFYPRATEQLRKELGITDQTVVLSVASNLMLPEKGGELIIKLSEKLQDREIVFILVGVPKKKQPNLKNVISYEGISSQHFLAKLYSVADLTLILSKKETFSLVAAESIACGTPVLGFESGATQEVIGVNGLLVQYGEIEEIERIILELKSTESLKIIDKESLGKFSKKRMFAEYFRLYGG